jgi:hypothetical protein
MYFQPFPCARITYTCVLSIHSWRELWVKSVVINCHRPGDRTMSIYFLHFWRLGSLRSRCWQIPRRVVASLCTFTFFCCPAHSSLSFGLGSNLTPCGKKKNSAFPPHSEQTSVTTWICHWIIPLSFFHLFIHFTNLFTQNIHYVPDTQPSNSENSGPGQTKPLHWPSL